MKLLPAAVLLCCTSLIVSCGRQKANDAEIEKQVQERLNEEHQAQQQRELHEREAALDERERQVAEREQHLTIAAATPSVPAAPLVATPPPATPVGPPAAPAAPAATDASYQAFYDSLSPYGSWVEMPGYGYAWQPLAAVENSLWRPYTLGRWLFTDGGWTWASDEPFGWVVYHYGRWMRTRELNWVWVPGDQWAPAWVSWRYGNDYVGWAPLPPEARFDGAAGIQQWADQQYNLGASDYTFVPAAEFGDDNMAAAAIPAGDDDAIYDDSNNLTNIYSEGGSVICYGPNYEFLRSKSRRPLPPRLTLARAGYRADGRNAALVSGNTLLVAAPRISLKPAAPKAIRGRVADTRLLNAAATRPPARDISPPGNGLPPANALAPSQQPAPVAGGQPTAGMRSRSQMKPAPLEAEEKKAREVQAIEDQQASKAAREQAARDRPVRQIQPSGTPFSGAVHP